MMQRWILKAFLVPAFLALNAHALNAYEMSGYSPRENAAPQRWCNNVIQISGTREGKNEILCRANPPGKASGQGNTADTKVCIKPLPAGMPKAQANMLCDKAYGPLMRGYTGTKALEVCRERHNVKCEKVNCNTQCYLTVVVTNDEGVTYDRNDPLCPGKDPIAALFGWTASCTQRSIWYDCDCACAKPDGGGN